SFALLFLALAEMAGLAVMVVVENHFVSIRTVDARNPALSIHDALPISVCVGSLFLASRMQRGSEDIVRERARRSILAAAVYLTIEWLWILMGLRCDWALYVGSCSRMPQAP